MGDVRTRTLARISMSKIESSKIKSFLWNNDILLDNEIQACDEVNLPKLIEVRRALSKMFCHQCFCSRVEIVNKKHGLISESLQTRYALKSRVICWFSFGIFPYLRGKNLSQWHKICVLEFFPLLHQNHAFRVCQTKVLYSSNTDVLRRSIRATAFWLGTVGGSQIQKSKYNLVHIVIS